MTRRYTKKADIKKDYANDIIGIVCIIIGILLLVFATYRDTGIVGKVVDDFLQGLFGVGKYCLAVSFICSGIVLAIDSSAKLSNKVIQSVILAIFFASIAYMGHGNLERLNDIGFQKYMNEIYTNSIMGKNSGGTFGGLLASVTNSLLGNIGSYVVLYALTIILALSILDLKFKRVFEFIKNAVIKIFEGIADMTADMKETFEDDDIRKTKREMLKEERLRAKEDRIQAREEMLKEKHGSNKIVNQLKVNDKDNFDQIEFILNDDNTKKIKAQEQRDEFFKRQKEDKEDKNIKEVLQLEHTSHNEIDNYIFPSLELLTLPNKKETKGINRREVHDTAVKLQKTLASFGVEAKVTNVTHGPAVTRYELSPSTGVKVSKIVNLSDDIALNLAAKSIRIEAPIPGKAAVGIEIPNKDQEMVYLRDILASPEFTNHSSKLAYSLGKDVAGDIKIGDIAKMPHMLIAGSTGSGKSVCINCLITSILYKSKPSEVKLILIDPKMVELSGYNGIPHLLIPVVTDPKKAAGALSWAVQEMVNRYKLFADNGVKDIKGYNELMASTGGEGVLPQIVIIIDELADLMMVAQNDVEDAICRLAQMARAAGMHLVIATQRPSVDVITGIIKANIPSRVAFAVSSQVDSRTILDGSGAEHLLGKGDMLYFPTGDSKPTRIQGAFVSEKEVEAVVEAIKKTSGSNYDENIIEKINNAGSNKCGGNNNESDSDEFLSDAIIMSIELGQASASMVQRRFKVGYARAGRIIDQMETRGIISGYEGSKPRQVLITKSEWEELQMGQKNEGTED